MPLAALGELLAGTNLEGVTVISTRPDGDAVYNERNLVIVSRLPVLSHQQLRNDLADKPTYRRLTAVPADPGPGAGRGGPADPARRDRPHPGRRWPAACDQRAFELEDPHRHPGSETGHLHLGGR